MPLGVQLYRFSLARATIAMLCVPCGSLGLGGLLKYWTSETAAQDAFSLTVQGCPKICVLGMQDFVLCLHRTYSRVKRARAQVLAAGQSFDGMGTVHV
jgi:hypothetical protein